MVKRYLEEPGSDEARVAIEASNHWATCRICFAETKLALALAGPRRAPGNNLDDDWPHFHVVDVDQRLVESASELGTAENLRTLDALHLAAALSLGRPLTIATWDRALHAAARRRGLDVLPESLG